MTVSWRLPQSCLLAAQALEAAAGALMYLLLVQGHDACLLALLVQKLLDAPAVRLILVATAAKSALVALGVLWLAPALRSTPGHFARWLLASAPGL